MGNDMLNDEQLAHAEIALRETEEGLAWWKERALVAEHEAACLTTARNAALTLAEQRGAAYDMTWREVESLREWKDKLEAERDEARAEVAKHVRERALLMNWVTDKDGTGCDGCHGSTAGDQDLMLLCQPCGEKYRTALSRPASVLSPEVREAADAAQDDLGHALWHIEEGSRDEAAKRVRSVQSALLRALDAAPAPAPSAPALPSSIRCALPLGECCHQRPVSLPSDAPEADDGDGCCRYCGRGLDPCEACAPSTHALRRVEVR